MAKRRGTLVTTSWTFCRTGTRIRAFVKVLVALISTGFVAITGFNTVTTLGPTEINAFISKFKITSVEM